MNKKLKFLSFSLSVFIFSVLLIPLFNTGVSAEIHTGQRFCFSEFGQSIQNANDTEPGTVKDIPAEAKIMDWSTQYYNTSENKWVTMNKTLRLNENNQTIPGEEGVAEEFGDGSGFYKPSVRTTTGLRARIISTPEYAAAVTFTAPADGVYAFVEIDSDPTVPVESVVKFYNDSSFNKSVTFRIFIDETTVYSKVITGDEGIPDMTELPVNKFGLTEGQTLKLAVFNDCGTEFSSAADALVLVTAELECVDTNYTRDAGEIPEEGKVYTYEAFAEKINEAAGEGADVKNIPENTRNENWSGEYLKNKEWLPFNKLVSSESGNIIFSEGDSETADGTYFPSITTGKNPNTDILSVLNSGKYAVASVFTAPADGVYSLTEKDFSNNDSMADFKQADGYSGPVLFEIYVEYALCFSKTLENGAQIKYSDLTDSEKTFNMLAGQKLRLVITGSESEPNASVAVTSEVVYVKELSPPEKKENILYKKFSTGESVKIITDTSIVPASVKFIASMDTEGAICDAAKKEFGSGAIYKIYNLSLLNDDGNFIPTEKLDVDLSFTTGFDDSQKADFQLYRYKTDGSFEKIESVFNKNELIVTYTATEIGPVMLIDANTVKDADNKNLLLWMAATFVIIVIGTVAVFKIIKKKK